MAMAKSTSTKENPIRLVLIEDHADFRESVSMVLEERGGYQCVGGFSTMEDALEAIRGGLVADLVLSDLGLPGMSGIAGIRKVRELVKVGGTSTPLRRAPVAALPSPASTGRRWSRHRDNCLRCGRDSIKHLALGYCRSCYPKRDQATVAS